MKTKQKLFKLIATIVAIVTIATLCTGCAQLRNKEAVVEDITSCIPGITNFTAEDGKTPYGHNSTIYTFETDGFSFIYYEYLDSTSGGFSTTRHETDYYKKLFEFKASDIEAIAREYGVRLIENELTDADFDGSNIYAYIHHENNGEITFYLYVVNSTYIDRVFDFVDSMWKSMESHIPTQEGLCTQTMNVNLYNAKQDSLVSQQTVNMWGDINFSEARIWGKYEYEADVLDEIIDDDTVNTSKVKPRTVSKIYVNDGILKELKTDAKFYYNPVDGQYYVLVCYGVDLDNPYEAPGYLHREIIERCYPRSSYEVVSSLKEKSSTYVIGQDEFCIEWSKRDTEKGELLFHKNGTLMEIKTYKNVGPISNKASYNRFISVEDFAKLLNMSVEVTPYAMKFTRNS